MVHDRAREGQDLAAVHHFYIRLVQERLGHEIPLPDVVNVALLRRWLNLLDLAITPLMVRDALKEGATRQTAESLLRFYMDKASPEDQSRDKADFVATFLFRLWQHESPALPPPPEGSEEVVYYASMEAANFERELVRILGTGETGLPTETRQLASEFGFIRSEVEEFQDFDRMMDSGVVQRVREIKQSFGVHFYHPAVLAAVASYNAYFGKRFDELFRMATEQIKNYAARVQEEGGSILSRVDEDVIVKELTEVEEQKILGQEYGRAQEQFRRVSRYRKAVEKKRRKRPAEDAAAAARIVAGGVRTGKSERESLAGMSRAAKDEEVQVHIMQESIRSFVGGTPSGAVIMPLRGRNFILTAAEADAFRADYGGEKSFRGQYATLITQSMAIQARMIVETAEYQKHKDSEYLWKGPAEALAAQLAIAEVVGAQGSELAQLAAKRGLEDKAVSIRNVVEKLRQLSQTAAGLLRDLKTE